MEDQRSSIVQQNRSINSSLIRQSQSLSPLNTLVINNQKHVSPNIFIQSCPYRTENIHRNAIIKQQDIKSCLKRLSNREDVHGVIVVTIDGRILYECDALKNWIPTLVCLCSFARHLVRDNDPNDHIQALRLRTKNYEIIITIHNEQLLIVMQMLLSSSDKNDLTVTKNRIEEDWEVFLKRIQEQKLETE